MESRPKRFGKYHGCQNTSEMFHPDNIKNKHKDSQNSISLHTYWESVGGPKGLA